MSNFEEFVDAPPDEVAVHGFIHRPSAGGNDGIVLTHGAGANCASPLLVALATAFCELGMTALRCDLAFRQRRPKGPPPRGSAERDQQGLRRAVGSMRQMVNGSVCLGGHSYGGRQATMLAAAEPSLVDALLLLSYPLHPPTKPTEMRTAHLPTLTTPALFAHGTRDGFGSIDEIRSAMELIPARTELLTIEGAGHELASASRVKQVGANIAAAFLEFRAR